MIARLSFMQFSRVTSKHIPKIVSGVPVTWKKKLKTGCQNVTDVYLKSCKKQNKGDRDLIYGLKWLLGCPLSDLGG